MMLTIAGCGGSQPQITPSIPVQSSAVTKQVRPDLPDTLLYSFLGAPDGTFPESNLINVGGTFYGTTFQGGTGGSCLRSCGTVYSMTPAGVESVVYSFQGGTTDGSYPSSDLLDVSGTLYGTTQYGGTGLSSECGYSGCGVVFSVTPAGVETVLYSFQGTSGGDGSVPAAGLVTVGGKLYGTTALGGTHGQGAVFSITTAGVEHVIYNFAGGAADGSQPSSDLTNVGGTLYGNTVSGGSSNNGTVFSMTTAGTLNWLYSFAGSPNDGCNPLLAGMIVVANHLYGTTEGCGAAYQGIVFKITTAGVESVLHSFPASAHDGEGPTASLLYRNPWLYGTTDEGGGLANGYGTVFKLKTNGAMYHVIHRFHGGPGDGEYPRAGLIRIANTLYGATYYGGSTGNCCSFAGYGSFFSL
jgi:uncharacterized repeat protein (TIGR03803 family)